MMYSLFDFLFVKYSLLIHDDLNGSCHLAAAVDDGGGVAAADAVVAVHAVVVRPCVANRRNLFRVYV